MRNLNSILIEGVLLDTPVLSHATSADAPPKCIFSICSEPDVRSVPIVVYGRLAAFCSKRLFQGSVIRVVGRIAQDTGTTAATGTFPLCVVAEHIEPKPVPIPKLIPEESAHVL